MKRRSTIFSLCLFAVLSLNGQSLTDHFTTPGWNSNAQSINFSSGTNSISYSYHQTETVCGETALAFVHHISGQADRYIVIQGELVYTLDGDDCSQALLDDF